MFCHTAKLVNRDLSAYTSKLYINRVGFSQQRINVPLDSLGNFSTSFDSYIPTDVRIGYRKSFLVLTHPGDSIFVELDGVLYKETEILKTIKFGGNRVKSNRDAAAFQRMFYSDPSNSSDSINQVYKEFDIDQFCNYLDESRIKSKTLLDKFVSDTQPTKEVQIWASEFADNRINYRITLYPLLHQHLNNLEYKNNFNEFPDNYYTPNLKRKSISKSMFISGAAVTQYFRRYIGAYRHINKLYKYGFEAQGKSYSRTIADSLMVYGLLNESNNSLFTQLVLTTVFSQRITMESDIEFFETYQDVLEKHIQEPFLRKPLFELYKTNKRKLENQIENSEAIKNEASNISEDQILDSIILSNVGKVIYLDCWATWCGPCIAAMPNSKVLMKEMHDKDVVFAFLCLHSEKKDWQSTINKLHIGGQHYFLLKERSMEFARMYAINGVPNYLLINKQGNIVDQGIHLRPSVVKEKIEKLLKENFQATAP